MNDFDIDDNIVNTIFSKYHTLNEISQLNLSRKNFSIFHTNIRSLSKHIDSLHTQLCSTNIPFDIIGITETKQQVDKNFLLMWIWKDTHCINNPPKVPVEDVQFMSILIWITLLEMIFLPWMITLG